MKTKIQTGIRIPEELHKELQTKADRMGVSINQLMLVLIDMGLNLMEKGVIPREEQE